MLALTAPEDGTPPLIDDAAGLQIVLEQLAAGAGPIAIDAERASGFRYSARAYLIQIFRRGGGLHLIDPIALAGNPLIAQLGEILSRDEVVIHASTQDLPCLREFGINPKILFDTELGARIAGLERVGLAPLCESLLEISLAKEHSAVDWSIRPLLQEWLDYAALDVLVLLDLKDKVEMILKETSKLEYAREDFASILKAPPAKAKSDPWRRTSGMHLIKGRFELAIIRYLWTKRDQIAQQSDIAAGRLLSDSILVDIARYKPQSKSDFLSLPSVRARIKNERLRDRVDLWWDAIGESYQIPESDWPEMRGRGEGLPPPRIWKEKYPRAHAHLTHARHLLQEISHANSIPVENLLTPDLVRRVLFDEGREARHTLDSALIEKVSVQLREGGAREWQITLCAQSLALALTLNQPLIKEVSEEDSKGGPTPSDD